MKSIFAINPTTMENAKCLIVKACASFIDSKVGVSLDHGVILFSSVAVALHSYNHSVNNYFNQLQSLLPYT